MMRTIKLLPLLAPFFFFVAYLHLKFFYTTYSIMIEQWIGLNELVMLFLDDLSSFVWYGGLILISAFSAFRFKDKFGILRKNKFHLGKNETRVKMIVLTTLSHLVLIMMLGFFLLVISLDKAKTPFDKWADSLFAVFALFATTALLYARKEIQEFLNVKITNFSALVFVSFVAFLSHSLTNAFKKTRRLSESKVITIVTEKGTEIPRKRDSLTYLGKCSDYYFLYNKWKGAPLVIEIEKVGNLEMYLIDDKKRHITKFEVQH